MARIAPVAAGAGIHGGDEHEARRKGEGEGGSADGDGVILEGLAQRFDDMLAELGQLVEKEDAVVGEGDFTWFRVGPAADEAGIPNSVLCGGFREFFLLGVSDSTITDLLPSLILYPSLFFLLSLYISLSFTIG